MVWYVKAEEAAEPEDCVSKGGWEEKISVVQDGGGANIGMR